MALPHLLCFLLLLLLLPYPTTAQTNTNISLGSSLSALNKNNSSWASSSGDFAFGFQQVEEGGFLLAIWFNKVPEKTIVWSANGDQLVPSGSKIQLTTDGQFVLNDPKGKRIWSANSAGTGVAYAAMLDTGNFVLARRDFVNLWESFDHPTDTIVPTQTLKQGSKLVAHFSETNYSNGRFLFTLQEDGNLVLYTTDFPLDSVNFAYWASDTVGSGFQLIFNKFGSINLLTRNGSVLNQILSNAGSTRDFYQRAILEYDGVLRKYVYPKKGGSSSGRWPMAWSTLSFIPSNICTRITASTGSGACGFNSYCKLGDDQRPDCECPPGYTPLDPMNRMNGCKQNFVSQSCDKASQEAHLFEFREMINTDWPLSDYEHFEVVTEDWCREACLGDCFCAVAIFRDGDCWKKKVPLSNGRLDSSVGGKTLIKVRKDNSTSKSTNGGSNKKLVLNGSMVH